MKTATIAGWLFFIAANMFSLLAMVCLFEATYAYFLYHPIGASRMLSHFFRWATPIAIVCHPFGAVSKQHLKHPPFLSMECRPSTLDSSQWTMDNRLSTSLLIPLRKRFFRSFGHVPVFVPSIKPVVHQKRNIFHYKPACLTSDVEYSGVG